MLKNNTRLISINPGFNKLITKECLERLAGTRKLSKERTVQADEQVRDDFAVRLAGSRSAGSRTSSPQRSAAAFNSKVRQQPKSEFGRAYNKRSKSTGQMLSILHEEEIHGHSKPESAFQLASSDEANDCALKSIKNAKGSGSIFCRFGKTESGLDCPENSTYTSGDQQLKTRSKGLRSRVFGPLLVLKHRYRHFLNSVNGEDEQGDVSYFKFEPPFAADLDVSQAAYGCQPESQDVTGFFANRFRFRRSVSCKA